jgi:hypothetical protein
MAKKTLIKRFQDIVADEALDAMALYDVKYEFHDYSGEVETVYVSESEGSSTPVEFHMLKKLEGKLKKIDLRYQVGIIHEDLPAEDE